MNSGLGPMKEGTAPKIGITHYYWKNLQTQSSPGPLSFLNSNAYYATKRFPNPYLTAGIPARRSVPMKFSA